MPAMTALLLRWLLLTGLVATIAPPDASSGVTGRFERPLAALSVVQQQANAKPEVPASAALAEGRRLLERRDLEHAKPQFERASGAMGTRR